MSGIFLRAAAQLERFARQRHGACNMLGTATLAAMFLHAAVAQDTFGEATRQPLQGRQPQTASPPANVAGGSSRNPRETSAAGIDTPRQQVGGAGIAADSAAATDERRDFGVPPSSELHAGEMHGPTPNAIPGGQVITTNGLVELLRGRRAPVLLLDVLGGPEVIEGAVYAVPAAQPGSYSDPVQQQFGQFLQQATAGNPQYPIVLYCLSPQCWMSYNAALRAIHLGYTNVLWYRGGIESWKSAGLPIQPGQR
jgi:PQQ-dependent catabolism-associated CXXCW motif protein